MKQRSRAALRATQAQPAPHCAQQRWFFFAHAATLSLQLILDSATMPQALQIETQEGLMLHLVAAFIAFLDRAIVLARITL